mmetsp:Transcript_5396/g.11935  ORF Transcript_5396/g.11935 Transcript_5396/m.11935 type:complete len:951 (-) Transcript_5396:276-3128(-)
MYSHPPTAMSTVESLFHNQVKREQRKERESSLHKNHHGQTQRPLRSFKMAADDSHYESEQSADSSVLVVEIPELAVNVNSLREKTGALPLEIPSSEEEEQKLKELVWETHKDEIFKSMKLTIPSMSKAAVDHANATALEKANQRLFLLDQISDVQRQFLQKKEPRAVFGYLLSGLLDLMDSEYGFIGEIKWEDDGTMYLQTHAITNIAWNQATLQFYNDNIQAGLKFTNLDTLFGHVMTNAEPVIANNPGKDPRSKSGGVPEGHPPLNHFLGIPFFEPGGTKMNGMVGIANKPGGYSKADVDFLDPFVVTCSNLIQAYGAMQENVRLINTLEEKVRERTSRLEAANRQVMEASAAQLRNFACMSHEIRTPLNCIVGLSSLMLEGDDFTPQQVDSMKMIVTSGELLSAIVNDVLDYSKLISGNVDIDIQPTDLQATLDAVVHSIEVKARERKLQLWTDYDPLIPKIIATDGRRLQQILYNLLGNATKFSKENGRVELTIQLVQVREKENPVKEKKTPTEQAASEPPSQGGIETSGNPPSGCPFHRSSSRNGDGPSAVATRDSLSLNHKEAKTYLRFVVKDYGKGIENTDFKKIFQPFRQASGETEKLYGGTGLGLAITSKLVERLGGRISVDSILGQWSEFTVDLPFDRAPVDSKALSTMLSDSRIMIVNKDQDQRLSDNLVNTFKLNVVEFESCAELRLLSKVKGAIDDTRSYICLVHEDLYVQSDLMCFAEAASRTTLLTFGPKYMVKDNSSRGHYRSLAHVLPSAFLDSLIEAKAAARVTPASSTESNQLSASGSAGIANPGNLIVAPLPARDHGNLKVLVAEDNLINQKVLRNMLRRVGIVKIDIVDNGKKAVDKSALEDYDLILMDMQMPVMDGVEATKLIVHRDKERANAAKVVFVTANAMESFEKQARDAGAYGYIAKPFNMKKIEGFLNSFETTSKESFVVAS